MEKISFIRGDTFPMKFQILDSERNVVPKSELETLYLTCRKFNSLDSPKLFQKKIEDFVYDDEDGFYYIAFNPEDTRELEYGTYNFDIEATFKDGYVNTLKSSFEIIEETTIYEGE